MSETITEAPAVNEAPAEAPAPAAEAPGDDLHAIIRAAMSGNSEAPSERARDAHGRFASGHNGGPPLEPETPAAQAASEEPPAPTAVERPEAWDETAWNGLSPEHRERVAMRERDLRAALENRIEHTQEVERYREVAAPYRERMEKLGVEPHVAFGRLLEWERAIRSDPANALVQLAQSVGLDLRTLVQSGASVDPSQTQFRDPRVDQLLAEREAMTRAEQQRAQAAIDADIAAFKADSRNAHFDAVRVRMGHLMMADPSLTIRDAYDAAIWADPKLRADRLAKEVEARDAERRKAEADRAKAARQASVGVRDSAPGGTNGHALPVAAGMSLEDQIRAVMRQAS